MVFKVKAAPGPAPQADPLNDSLDNNKVTVMSYYDIFSLCGQVLFKVSNGMAAIVSAIVFSRISFMKCSEVLW